FCSYCGAALQAKDAFCPRCGKPVARTAPVSQPQPAPVPRPQPAPATRTLPQPFRFAASSFTGETALGGLQGGIGAIESPGKVIGDSVKGFFSSFTSLFKDPKRWIPIAALAVVWLILNILQTVGFDILPTRVLSFLTFANGGMSGGILGAIGGVIGKGVFAGAVVSLIGLFTRKGGEKRSFAQTLKGAFGVSLDSLWSYLTGIGGALLLYLLMAGGDTRMAFMGGVAAAFLSARAALSGGFLQKLFSSFTAKSRTMSSSSLTGLIRGMSVGFAAAALIGMPGMSLLLIVPGALLLVGGGVMMILQATGVVNLGKGAPVQ
ncbi:MAG: zinc-ribbon domain-containing protein, partial [Acutalibacteraceae bacterium]